MDPFIGQIIAVAFNYAPQGWMPCDGRLLQIRENSALFALLGTMYGGDGQATFGLPNLNGRVILGMSPAHPPGQTAGAESVQLNQAQLPAHTHTATFTPSVQPAFDGDGTLPTPKDNVPAKAKTGLSYSNLYAPVSVANASLGVVPGSGGTVNLGLTGTGAGVPTMPPYQALNYIIATSGIFPSRQ